jgi:hypothetical protein
MMIKKKVKKIEKIEKQHSYISSNGWVTVVRFWLDVNGYVNALFGKERKKLFPVLCLDEGNVRGIILERTTSKYVIENVIIIIL